MNEKPPPRPALPSLEPLQLGLFGEAVPTGTPAIQHQSSGATRSLNSGGSFQSFRQSNQDALAAVTVLFNRGEVKTVECTEQARELLTGQSVADLREVALGAAFIASMLLGIIDGSDPGAGEDLLEELGFTLAERDD
jgi:hypothetical protein